MFFYASDCAVFLGIYKKPLGHLGFITFGERTAARNPILKAVLRLSLSPILTAVLPLKRRKAACTRQGFPSNCARL